jgi:putative transposase
MARPLRVAIAEGWYHVFGRGLERREIFLEDRDGSHLLELFETLHERYRIRIHAYALMDNHYHAVLQTPDANLSQGMQWLHGAYSAWYNARHERVGPLFQGRYRAIPAEGNAP